MRTGENAEPKVLAALDQTSISDAAARSAHLPGASLGLSARNMPGSNIAIYI
jgi:hypothetical protein